MIYFTSDLHFCHRRLAQSWGKRPWEHTGACTFWPDKENSCNCDITERMNNGLIESINKYVKPDDTLIHMGDFAFQPKKEVENIKVIVSKLNGNIRYCLGNHDSVKNLISFGIPKENIFESDFIILGGIKFFMAHFPYPNGMKEEDKTERPYAYSGEQYENGKITPLLCGHVHDRWALVKNCLNVGWDIWKKPLSIMEIFEIYKETNGFIENLEKYNEI